MILPSLSARRCACFLLTLLGAGLAAASPAHAEAPAGYQPYVPPAAEQVSAPLFVLLAYAALWLVLLLFVISVWRRQRRLEVELASLLRREEERR